MKENYRDFYTHIVRQKSVAELARYYINVEHKSVDLSLISKSFVIFLLKNK